MCIGALTLLIGAIAGCAYDDIKKVLAYSTVSQIGYMFLAVGLGPVGYVAALAHLLAHGFFKAGLFLGAGSVMHAMNDQVDMRRFGGLWKKLPITFCDLRARLPRADRASRSVGLLDQGRDHRGHLRPRRHRLGYALGVVAVLGAGLTAFYMTRLMIMTFFGRAAVGGGRPPARGAAGHDGADGRAGRSARWSPASCWSRRSRCRDWLAPVFGEPKEADARGRAADLRHRAVRS